jgi:hypothetical protein
MKLLAEEMGWAATDKKLFWTIDGGTNWKDITPKAKADWRITSAFLFRPITWLGPLRAPRQGEARDWNRRDILRARRDRRCPEKTWLVKHLNVPDPDPAEVYREKHGWILSMRHMVGFWSV